MTTRFHAYTIVIGNQALNADSNQSLAHLYLAHELDREGKAQEAASHYEAFLRFLARQRPQDRPTPDFVISIVLRMAAALLLLAAFIALILLTACGTTHHNALPAISSIVRPTNGVRPVSRYQSVTPNE